MPSFSIEAEGEKNPLSVHDILRTLASASGAVTTQQSLQVATQQLANWESTPGYYSLLQDVYSDFNQPEDIRFQAIIQLKNGIDKYWRKTSTHAISKSEKARIREQAINTGVRESRSALALQNALMLAKIVRYEFPHDWPDVISVIIHHLRDATNQMDSNRVSNILIITLQIIKELASGRLQRTKKSLASVASELLNVLGQLYVGLIQRWLSDGANIQDMINSHSALKTLRRLLNAGFEHPHREPLVQQMWTVLQEHQERIWSIWMRRQSTINEQTILQMKHLFQYSKLYLDMARDHAASFVSLGCMNILNRSWEIINGEAARVTVSGSVEWVVGRDGEMDNDSQPIEKLALKALLLFRACIKMVFNPVQSFKYQHPQDKLDKKLAIDQIRVTVFTNDFVVQLMEILVTRYFVLRPSDLREWEEEPDEWEKREEEIVDAWEFSLRTCSEKLFLDLVINYKELLVPRLLEVFRQHVTLENQDVLLKDSLYSAIGISAACIEDVFDFNALIFSTLLPEVQSTAPHYHVLRRRIAILLGQWVPIKPESLDRKAIYQIFASLLSSEDKLNDPVVRVTAGRQLRPVLDPFEFRYEDFEPYATSIFSSIMQLITETELSETKMALLETVRVGVTKLEDKIEPYAQAIMSLLPSLWAQSGEEHLMKQAILTMITAIITSLGPKGVSFHGPVLPVIRDAVQLDSEAIVYLLEDALDLWTAIMQQTPSVDPLPFPELLGMITNLLPLLDMGSDHLRQCFELIDSYIFLSPTTLLDSAVLNPLLRSLKELLKMLSSSRPRVAALAPSVLENLIAVIAVTSAIDDSARPQAIQHLMSTLIDTGYFAEVCRLLKEAHDYHQDPRPNLRPPEIIGVGETSLFTLLSRLALLSPELFVQALPANGFGLDWLVIEWISNFDSIGNAIRKKLQTMGLTNLIRAATPPPAIMIDRLQDLMTIWTDVVIELSEGAADESQGDYLWSGAGNSAPEWPGETPEDSRKRAVTNSDPTYVENIRPFIAERLRLVIAQVGGPSVFEQEYLGRIDSAILTSFVQLQIL